MSGVWRDGRVHHEGSGATHYFSQQAVVLMRSADWRRLASISWRTGAVGQQCHDDTGMHGEFWGEASNCRLDPAKGCESRRVGMEYFRTHERLRKGLFRQCKYLAGKLAVHARRIDASKKDEPYPKYRSGLVANDFKRWADHDLYTPTPPSMHYASLSS